jgi:hypothetical protein
LNRQLEGHEIPDTLSEPQQEGQITPPSAGQSRFPLAAQEAHFTCSPEKAGKRGTAMKSKNWLALLNRNS